MSTFVIASSWEHAPASLTSPPYASRDGAQRPPSAVIDVQDPQLHAPVTFALTDLEPTAGLQNKLSSRAGGSNGPTFRVCEQHATADCPLGPECADAHVNRSALNEVRTNILRWLADKEHEFGQQVAASTHSPISYKIFCSDLKEIVDVPASSITFTRGLFADPGVRTNKRQTASGNPPAGPAAAAAPPITAAGGKIDPSATASTPTACGLFASDPTLCKWGKWCNQAHIDPSFLAKRKQVFSQWALGHEATFNTMPNDALFLVHDPVIKRSVDIPRHDIAEFTRGLFQQSGAATGSANARKAPSLCLLFQKRRCTAGACCNQIHVRSEAVAAIRMGGGQQGPAGGGNNNHHHRMGPIGVDTTNSSPMGGGGGYHQRQKGSNGYGHHTMNGFGNQQGGSHYNGMGSSHNGYGNHHHGNNGGGYGGGPANTNANSNNNGGNGLNSGGTTFGFANGQFFVNGNTNGGMQQHGGSNTTAANGSTSSNLSPQQQFQPYPQFHQQQQQQPWDGARNANNGPQHGGYGGGHANGNGPSNHYNVNNTNSGNGYYRNNNSGANTSNGYNQQYSQHSGQQQQQQQQGSPYFMGSGANNGGRYTSSNSVTPNDAATHAFFGGNTNTNGNANANNRLGGNMSHPAPSFTAQTTAYGTTTNNNATNNNRGGPMGNKASALHTPYTPTQLDANAVAQPQQRGPFTPPAQHAAEAVGNNSTSANGLTSPTSPPPAPEMSLPRVTGQQGEDIPKPPTQPANGNASGKEVPLDASLSNTGSPSLGASGVMRKRNNPYEVARVTSPTSPSRGPDAPQYNLSNSSFPGVGVNASFINHLTSPLASRNHQQPNSPAGPERQGAFSHSHARAPSGNQHFNHSMGQRPPSRQQSFAGPAPEFSFTPLLGANAPTNDSFNFDPVFGSFAEHPDNNQGPAMSESFALRGDMGSGRMGMRQALLSGSHGQRPRMFDNRGGNSQ